VSASFDFSELTRLAVDLGDAPAEVSTNVRKAVQVTSHKIKDQWRKEAKRSGLAGYASSITYDTKETRGGVEGEIGPELSRNQGSFGFVEEGGEKVQSSPQHAARNAVRSQQDDFVKGIEKAARDIL